MNSCLISIIIPAYNVEQYIQRCLDTIYSQKVNRTTFEVILVDDGSTDSTLQIVKEYVLNYNNLTIISQQNSGASAARNAGIRKAKGDYIWFVDSDDAISENSIETILHYVQQYSDAEFLVFDCRQLDLEKKTESYWKTLNDRYWGIFHRNLYHKPLTREECGSRIRSAVLWLLVYRREYLLNYNLFLTEGIINEDNEFFMRLFFHAKKIYYIPFAHYLYTLYRPGSVTTLNMFATMKMVDAAKKTILVWDEFCKKNVCSTDDWVFVSRYFMTIYARLLSFQKADKKSEVYMEYLKHKKEWKKGYIHFFTKSKFSLIGCLRCLTILLFPKYYDYISFGLIKKFFKFEL